MASAEKEDKSIPARICAKDLDKNEVKKYRKKWNVPDWAKLEDYDYMKFLTHDQLRWEFLRRNEKYRQMSDSDTKPRTHFLLGGFLAPNVRGDKLPKDFVFADSVRRGGGLALIPPPMKLLLFRPGDPDPTAPYDAVDAYFGAQLRELGEEDFLVVAIDPFRPMKGQIKTIKELLKSAKEDIKEQAPEMLLTGGSKRTVKLKYAAKLLRVLDADNEKVSDREIGTEIYKKKDYSDAAATGNQHLKRALKYYRTL